LATATLCALIGGYLSMDANAHSFAVWLPGEYARSPQLATKSAEEIRRLVDSQVAVFKWLWLLSPVVLLLANLLWTIVLLGANALGIRNVVCETGNRPRSTGKSLRITPLSVSRANTPPASTVTLATPSRDAGKKKKVTRSTMAANATKGAAVHSARPGLSGADPANLRQLPPAHAR